MNQNTNVNLIPKFPFSGNLYFSQYDVGRVATINLVEDGSAYTIPSGATVKIQATKPSGLGFSVECTYNGNVVTVVSTETMTNEYGRFPCELRIESGDVLLGTTNFTFNVEKSPHPTNTVDGDSEDIINQITVALNNALSDIQDAKEEAIEEISQSGGGITQAVKVALLNCFSHVAWIDENGQTYYDALEDALYDVPAPTLTSISAVYTQSGTVYTTDTLDSLKSDLVVTATYSDSSAETVPSADYTLSGTLTEGTSTITVSYGNQTTTFTVTVSPAPTPQVVTAINLPYGAYIDTEYVPTSVNHKYQLGVQLLSSEVPAANVWFAGMNRLPSSTTGAEEYWHIYFGTGDQANSKNDTYIQWSIGAYRKGLTSGCLRTSNSTSNKGSLITQTPYYIRIANGLQQIRANEAMTENLTSGEFAYMGSQTAYNAVTAENPIDSFFIGKLNQKGLGTATEYQGGVKIFCFRVFDENDTLLVDMHPAVLGADVGMYDSVRNEFYTASGTGATYDE